MKILIAGMGRVGSTLAYSVILEGLADELVLVNRNHELALGEAEDLTHADAFGAHQTKVYAANWDDTTKADIIIMAASAPLQVRQDGIPNRHDLVLDNWRLMENLLPRLAKGNPDAVLLMLSNPVDVLTYQAIKLTGFGTRRVIGTGTLLDSGRYRARLSQELGIHTDDLRAYVFGEHGETQFPVLSVAQVGGEPLSSYPVSEEIFADVLRSGGNVMRAKGYTNYGISQATMMIIRAIAYDANRTMPVSTLIEGYCGVEDVCLSVPVIVGRSGIVRRLEPQLSATENENFKRSAKVVKESIALCQKS